MLELPSAAQVAWLCGYADGYAMVDPNKLASADARNRSQDRRVFRFRRACDSGRELPTRTARRSGEMRSQQHSLPDDPCRGRKQAQHADRKAGEVQELYGTEMHRCPRSCRPSMPQTANATTGTRCGKSATRCTTFYRNANVKELQRLCFRASSFPELAMSPKEAYEALVANDVDYVPLEEVKGRISATLALIYPPGIGVIVPGERWDDKAQTDARLLPRFSGVVQPISGVQLRGAGCVPGTGRRTHQVSHLRRSRVTLR